MLLKQELEQTLKMLHQVNSVEAKGMIIKSSYLNIIDDIENQIRHQLNIAREIDSALVDTAFLQGELFIAEELLAYIDRMKS